MSKPKGTAYTFAFAAGLCLVCSLILAVAATALKPRQDQAVKLDIAVNLLTSVGHNAADLKAKKPAEVFEIYADEFEILLLDTNNKETDRAMMEKDLIALGYPEADVKEWDSYNLLTHFNDKVGLLAKRAGKSREEYDPKLKVLYRHVPAGNLNAYVIPIMGYGLWDLIKGYVALDLDLNTVKGISFYENKETPGLGARITEDWFKANYVGKKVLDESGALTSVTIVKGEAPDDDIHAVDGISGATLTCQGINQFLLSDLERYEPYFKTLRK